jgi:hypothetical protein
MVRLSETVERSMAILASRTRRDVPRPLSAGTVEILAQWRRHQLRCRRLATGAAVAGAVPAFAADLSWLLRPPASSLGLPTAMILTLLSIGIAGVALANRPGPAR